VRVGGKPVRASTSVAVEGENVPYALELPQADLGRGTYTWRLSVAGLQTLLPIHYSFGNDGDVDATPDGQLFLCQAAAVVDGRLEVFGARSELVIAPADTAAWALAGRLTVPAFGDMPVEQGKLDATLLDSKSSPVPGVEVHQTVEVRRPAKARADRLLVEVPVALPLPAVELAPGDYAWSVAAGGDLFEYVQLTVRA